MTADATPSTPPNGSPPFDDRTRSLSAADSTPTAAPTAADLPEQVGRYRIEGEIARGGMGVVLRASDPDFGRTLAVKILLDHRRGDEAAVRRFIDEARLCGQLQHPGVPPVHEMGTLPDGRPYFAMKLVKGETLAALLARRANSMEDLPRFLSIFEQVCQTVAYAHSREVIHRDLKPANVMVGAFGEVQVMDWGLAKALGARPEERTDPNATTAPTAVIGLRKYWNSRSRHLKQDWTRSWKGVPVRLDCRLSTEPTDRVTWQVRRRRPRMPGHRSSADVIRAAVDELGNNL